MNTEKLALSILMGLALVSTSQAQQASAPIRVTPDNFNRAETDMYYRLMSGRGHVGSFYHFRAIPEPGQTGVRPNRDTFYSELIMDLDAGPVTVTLPDPGKRFQSMMVEDEEQYIYKTAYGAGSYTFTRKDVGTRYALVALRIFVDPNDPADVAKVHALQDAVKVEQPGGPGKIEMPDWDKASQDKVRAALISLNDTMPDLKGAFGARGKVDPVHHLIGTASAWGGNEEKDAIYLNVTPQHNDGKTSYRLVVPPNVPVDAFWSVIAYDAKGYLYKTKTDKISYNSVTAKKGADGSVTIQFGGIDDGKSNYIEIIPGWNYMVRLYRPRPEILDGRWKFPEAQPVE